MLAPTPALFTVNALDFDYDPDAEPPKRWIRFVEQVWGDDPESVALLREWMGYCLVADTSQQKMLLLVGPRRSGKGTIGRILARLVGTGNVIGPTVCDGNPEKHAVRPRTQLVCTRLPQAGGRWARGDNRRGEDDTVQRSHGDCAMKTELRPLDAIKPYDNNPRVNDPAVDAVAESIRVLAFEAGASHREEVVDGFHLRVTNVPAQLRGSRALPEAKSRRESQGPANVASVRITREP